MDRLKQAGHDCINIRGLVAAQARIEPTTLPAPDDLHSRTVRDARVPSGPDFGCHVGDDIRAVLRNVENTAIMDGCVYLQA
jgi:hypothetical protein